MDTRTTQWTSSSTNTSICLQIILAHASLYLYIKNTTHVCTQNPYLYHDRLDNKDVHNAPELEAAVVEEVLEDKTTFYNSTRMILQVFKLDQPQFWFLHFPLLVSLLFFTSGENSEVKKSIPINFKRRRKTNFGDSIIKHYQIWN